MKWLALASLLLLATGCAHQTTQAAGRRLIVLGIDGMDPGFLESHWQALPNLNRLRQQGDFRRLATTVPPQSPVAWSTVATGLDPGGHGIFDFIHRDPVTRQPISSMAEATPPSHSLHIGPYLIPLTSGSVQAMRSGRTFWQILAERRIPATVIRIPANFPPAECEAESLAGMGTPDLTGTFGTFSFYTDDPAEKRSQVAGGHIAPIHLENGSATLQIEGPPNSLRKDQAQTAIDIRMHADPAAPVARFDLPDEQFVLRQGEWSDWQRADFRLIPGLKSVSGIFRIYLQQVHPHVRVYVSPVNIDPADPAMPISTPSGFSRTLTGKLGSFYTQGIAEETSAFRAGILSKDEFLAQSRKVLTDNLRMFHYELGRFSSGLLFYYFSSIDQNSHMLWGRYEEDLLDIYRQVDQAIGDAMRQPDTELMILSDHGFARFDRAVHLNTWLMKEGLLTLDDASNTGDTEGFAHVNWDKTQAYALGLNGIYLNLYGRESGGVVSLADKQDLLDQISAKLLEFRDPATGEHVVDKVYFAEKTYQGRNLKHAPDLIVGFRRGYRASWQTALGAVPAAAIDDNTQAWIGDHCMAADEVPGVLLSNRKFRATQPQMVDVPATILSEFGVPRAAGMLGQTVF
ncbi:MAG: nucleotide pyrophosphatase [Terriglobia bacterium]|nr:MAG: nucleotide pyrophosphatase [Terriglobia bacterium]